MSDDLEEDVPPAPDEPETADHVEALRYAVALLAAEVQRMSKYDLVPFLIEQQDWHLAMLPILAGDPEEQVRHRRIFNALQDLMSAVGEAPQWRPPAPSGLQPPGGRPSGPSSTGAAPSDASRPPPSQPVPAAPPPSGDPSAKPGA